MLGSIQVRPHPAAPQRLSPENDPRGLAVSSACNLPAWVFAAEGNRTGQGREGGYCVGGVCILQGQLEQGVVGAGWRNQSLNKQGTFWPGPTKVFRRRICVTGAWLTATWQSGWQAGHSRSLLAFLFARSKPGHAEQARKRLVADVWPHGMPLLCNLPLLGGLRGVQESVASPCLCHTHSGARCGQSRLPPALEPLP